MSLYYALGRLYKRRGEYQQAQEAWLSYPGFKANIAATTLAEATHADNSAAMLFWIGQHELAMPLLELSANSQTGSESSMTSAARVALLDGDLELAAAWSAERVRRYESKYGLRDFLELLHIVGQSQLAWDTFDQFQDVTQDAQMWSGALVGHRIASAATEDIAAWIQSSDRRREATVRSAGKGETIFLAARYLLMAGTMDRVPGAGFANDVSRAYAQSRPHYRHMSGVEEKNGEYESTKSTEVLAGKSRFKHDGLVPTPQELYHVEELTQIDHRYTMLAGAMTAFLNEDYENAFERFNEAAYYYYLDEYLPYYAFSAAALGKEKHLHAALAAREPIFGELLRKEAFRSSSLGYRFDEDMTYAVLAAFSGDHDSAMNSLRQALNNRPYLEERSAYPMYQIGSLNAAAKKFIGISHWTWAGGIPWFCRCTRGPTSLSPNTVRQKLSESKLPHPACTLIRCHIERRNCSVSCSITPENCWTKMARRI